MEGTASVINKIVDLLFFADIFLIFNSAFFDDNQQLITQRSTIAKDYLLGWFLIDLVAIVPFEWFVGSSGSTANLVRFTRIGRITKILKLMKLMRLMKL